MMNQVPTEVKYIRTQIKITLVGYIYIQLIVVYNGQADYWWLRSPNLYYDYNFAYYVDYGGNVLYHNVSWVSCGRRPALISIRCSSDSCNFMYHYVFFV